MSRHAATRRHLLSMMGGATVGSLATGVGRVAAQPDEARVTLNQQSVLSTDTTMITVQQADLPVGGYIVVHHWDHGADGAILGSTEYMEPGAYDNVAVEIDSPGTGSHRISAMLHQDDPANETLDFPGEGDPPYTVGGSPVQSFADVRFRGANVQFRNQAVAGRAFVVVERADLPEGGWIVIHHWDHGAEGAIVGKAGPFEPGTQERTLVNVRASLDDSGEHRLSAMLHLDDPGNSRFDFPGDGDPPYMAQGKPVQAFATVSFQ